MDSNQVLAKVGENLITMKDIEFLFKSFDPQKAARFRSEEGIKQLVLNVADQELIYLDAMDKGLDKEADFLVELDMVKASLLKQYSINKYIKTASVDENEVLEYYEKNKSDYQRPESVRASHILAKEEADAKRIIILLNNNMSFEEAAAKHSLCPSSAQGGDLGYFSDGKMVPEFSQAAFKMEVGEVTGTPVKTPFGYHIIKLTDRKEAGIAPYDEVKGEIYKLLVIQKQEKIYSEKVEELKKTYGVEVYI